MIRFVVLTFFLLPFLIHCGDDLKTTLMIDNLNGKDTLMIQQKDSIIFIHPLEIKAIELIREEERYHPIIVLRANSQTKNYDRYIIQIKNPLYARFSKLNGATMQEEGGSECLRIIKVLLNKAKL